MITNTVSKVIYTGDGTTKQFQVTFPFIATTDLQLFLRTISTGEYEEIDSNWSYNEGYVTYPVTGSAITDAKQIVIQRNTPLTQEKDHDVRLFTSEDIEGMTDKLTQITQELKRDIEEVSSPESIDIDIASAIGRHNVHPQAHYDLFANKVAKTGSTMTGDLTMAKNGTTVSGVRFLDENDTGYRIYSAKDASDNKQLRMFDTSAGNGMFLNGGDGNRPYYWDGSSNSYRILDVSDKTSLETSINSKANTDLSNVTKPYVTETYVYGTSWYRVWSDGWCEQGGYSTSSSVTFLQQMANTNYNICVTSYRNGQTSSGDFRYITSYSATGFSKDLDSDETFWWRVEGQKDS